MARLSSKTRKSLPAGERAMGVTGACAEVIYLNGFEHEPDFDRAVSNEELLAAVKARLRPLQSDEHVDEPVTPTTPFGI